MNSNKIKLLIEGMTCSHCEMTIEKKLISMKGIFNVKASYAKCEVNIDYDKDIISIKEIRKAINTLDYKVVDFTRKNQFASNTQPLYILIIILSVYFILNHFQLLNVTNYFPQIQSSMGYSMLFVIGLLTSLHCVAMCGGINLAQSLHSAENSRSVINSNLLYNLGRVVSYTVIGGIVGGIGSVISLEGSFRGAVVIIAGIFMIIMGFNMLNIFPWLRYINIKVPRFLSKRINSKKAKEKSSFYIGLLNGLMPCGPLQSMQLYALSTGSIVAGSYSMFLFSLGTVPLMFILGTISSKLNKKFTDKMLSICAMLVVVLGVGMINNGLSLSGVLIPQIQTVESVENTAQIEGEYQTITTVLDFGRYQPIIVKAGIPVKWIIKAETGKVNGCNNEIIIPEFDLEIKLNEGDNLIEFIPTETGQYGYSCWMGMIRSYITVIE
ncbi:sulfite exporter TauE/SafE family protein [Tissierella carlieri]|uniref:Sulfite exporter TauE/SafE family protein n=1 Tax=Tissierella carlieri TaxID=689904 RepID=A0ABT1SEF9_9FIRM|nr:sulfite exporter TauE/SafE family protein [Tissierella carlieri]MBU5313508.1 sulfite exporter TauE/SafE family protein [Tissierella carlieri]MCQ4924705.1 sulfite exporter TauE/SafE family protein [Tissierella carlieri]